MALPAWMMDLFRPKKYDPATGSNYPVSDPLGFKWDSGQMNYPDDVYNDPEPQFFSDYKPADYDQFPLPGGGMSNPIDNMVTPDEYPLPYDLGGPNDPNMPGAQNFFSQMGVMGNGSDTAFAQWISETEGMWGELDEFGGSGGGGGKSKSRPVLHKGVNG